MVGPDELAVHLGLDPGAALGAQVVTLRHDLDVAADVLQEEVPERDVGLGDLLEDGVRHVQVPIEVHAELLVAAQEAGALEGTEAHDVRHHEVVGLLEEPASLLAHASQAARVVGVRPLHRVQLAGSLEVGEGPADHVVVEGSLLPHEPVLVAESVAGQLLRLELPGALQVDGPAVDVVASQQVLARVDRVHLAVRDAGRLIRRQAEVLQERLVGQAREGRDDGGAHVERDPVRLPVVERGQHPLTMVHDMPSGPPARARPPPPRRLADRGPRHGGAGAACTSADPFSTRMLRRSRRVRMRMRWASMKTAKKMTMAATMSCR